MKRLLSSRVACLATIVASQCFLFTPPAPAASTVVAWGDNSIGQTTVPAGLTTAVAVSAGGGHSAVLNADGTVAVFGYAAYGQLDVPVGLANVVGVAAGFDHVLALRNDGTVVAWGRNHLGQTEVPPGLSNVAQVSANEHYSLALKTDGTVVGWGNNSSGQGNIPAGLNGVIAISAGDFHGLALKSDGTVAGWGLNSYGQSVAPAGLNQVVAIAGGGEHSLALKSDGTVVAWGADYNGQTDVPAGLSSVVAIAAGNGHNLALKADGTVVAWGWNTAGQTTLPAGLANVHAVSAGYVFSLAIVGDANNPAPIITCPSNVVLACTNCSTDPDVTGKPTATDNGPVTVSYSDSVNGDCPKVVTRTWTATDVGGKSSSCVQTITCQSNADQPPTITCPPNVFLACDSCDTAPENTGRATATGDGRVTISYRDSIHGECPKVVTRTWTASDESGKSATCVQTITCLPPSVVTSSSGCLFDRDPTTPNQDFRLLFTPDPRNIPCFRLTASNPGQFVYNIFRTGTPGEEVTFHVTLPYPFVTQGATPFHAFDSVSVLNSDEAQCLVPGNTFFANPGEIDLASYGSEPTTTVDVRLTIPASGFVFLAIHLDYGLKGHSGFTKNMNDDAVDCATGGHLLIPNHGSYAFSVSGAQNGTATIENLNIFKRNPGVAGLVRTTNSTDPVPGTTVKLISPRGVLLRSTVTDEDGFYLMIYKHTGKAATYHVSITTPLGDTQTEAVILKANGFVQVDFSVP